MYVQKYMCLIPMLSYLLDLFLFLNKLPYNIGIYFIKMLTRKRVKLETTDENLPEKRPYDVQTTQHLDGIIAERCNIHRRIRLSVYTVAYSPESKRVCVIRRMGRDIEIIKGQPPPCENLTFVEFYNATNPPVIFLEKSIPLFDSIDSCTWIGNWAIVGGFSGKLCFFSPFTSRFKRMQICATEILSMAQVDEKTFVLANKSGEIIMLSKNMEHGEDTNNETTTFPTFTVTTLKKFSNDRHLITIACSNNINQSVIAVGMVNWVTLLSMNGTQTVDIAIPHETDKPVVIWSLVFKDNYLFTGDSQGQVTIYNGLNGQILKTFKSHQDHVLTLTTNGEEVFASGADCRIQVFSCVDQKEGLLEWQQVGQRIFHTKDVHSLCTLNNIWLISGGVEGLFLSRKHAICKSQLQPECMYSSERGLILTQNLTNVDIWLKEDQSEKIVTSRRIYSNFKRKPKLFIRINSGSMGFIKQACITPDGNFVCVAGNIKGAVSVIRLNQKVAKDGIAVKYWSNENDQKKEKEQKEGGKAVTAMYCDNKYLYYATGEYCLYRLDLASRKLETLAKESVDGHIMKICSNPSGDYIIALTTNLLVLVFNFTAGSDIPETKCLLVNDEVTYDCAFFNNHQVILLMSNLSKHLMCYDLLTNQHLFTKANTELRINASEWISYLNSAAHDNQLLATTNKGRILIISNGPTVCSYLSNFTGDFETTNDIRIEPFWGAQKHSEFLTKMPNIILVGHSEDILQKKKQALSPRKSH